MKIRGDIFFHPIFGILYITGYYGHLVIRDANHDLNACASQGL
jgi:hypothetical protein